VPLIRRAITHLEIPLLPLAAFLPPLLKIPLLLVPLAALFLTRSESPFPILIQPEIPLRLVGFLPPWAIHRSVPEESPLYLNFNPLLPVLDQSHLTPQAPDHLTRVQARLAPRVLTPVLPR
jgi:hypothetical protein